MSHSLANHVREDVDMREDVNAYVMEPLMDAWLCGAQVHGRMEKEMFYKLLGDPNTVPDRLARGVGRDLMMAIGYALNHVELGRDLTEEQKIRIRAGKGTPVRKLARDESDPQKSIADDTPA